MVCPEAWRLKSNRGEERNTSQEAPKRGTVETRERRKHWISQQDLRSQIRFYAKVVYLLLFLLVIVVFLLEHQRTMELRAGAVDVSSSMSFLGKVESVSQIIPIPTNILLLFLVLGIVIFIWDLLERAAKGIGQQSGITDNKAFIALKGSEFLPSEELYSEKLQLSGRPDALIKEKRFTIPVVFVPKGKKIKDRHIAEILAFSLLVKETSGIEPPYGVIVLGSIKREVKVKNSPEKQRWITSLLDEMRAIYSENVPTVPTPKLYKCKNCDVRSLCNFSAYPPRNRT